VDITGVNGAGAVGRTIGTNAPSGAPTATLVTSRNNSWVLGVGTDFDNAVARTVGSNQSLINQYLTPAGDTYWVQMQNAVTPLAGTSVNINDTAPTGDRYDLTVVEVLPSTGPTYSISGTVSPAASGTGTTLTLTGPSTATTTADNAGNYTFNSVQNGSYTVTPSKAGVTFSPSNQPVTVNGADVSAVNFSILQPVLVVSPTALASSAIQGSNAPPPMMLNITNGGGSSLNYTTASDSSWLTATPSS